jgi:Fic family protein
MGDFDRKTPYNTLPLLPPTVALESTKVLRKTITASRALAQLNGAIVNLPNPQLFLDTIHLQEAKASSEVENIITTNDDLYKALVADKDFNDPASKEVLNYKEALWLGLERMETRPFITTNLCIEIMQCIKQNSSGIRTTPGTTLANAQGAIIYTPPSGEDVIRTKMANLEKFINEDEHFDPLVKLALMHYQFEAIHPFADGNGRTGRILMLLYLKLSGLLSVPAIYPSDYIIRNKAEYYRRLQAVTEKEDWGNWVLYILDMVETTAIKGQDRLKEVRQLMESMAEEIRSQLPVVYSKELIEVLFRLPYTKRQHLIDAGLGTPKTVGSYLTQLENAGFLRSEKVGKEKLYLNFRLMEVLAT